MLTPPEPILIADRFPALLDSLLDLLTDLTPEEWQRPTVAAGWSVKDMAGHLLGDEINILSGQRDRYHEPAPDLSQWEALVAFINQRNGVWVEAARRISPALLCQLLRETGQQANAFFATLDPFATGGPVDWAGSEPAPVWLDLAREFTERWHHQQHIRDALNRPGSTQPYFLAPVLAAFVRALPHTYRDFPAPDGTFITLHISGPAGSVWTVARESGRWVLYAGEPPRAADARLSLPEDSAWRLFTRGINADQALAAVQITGDRRLALQALRTISIIA